MRVLYRNIIIGALVVVVIGAIIAVVVWQQNTGTDSQGNTNTAVNANVNIANTNAVSNTNTITNQEPVNAQANTNVGSSISDDTAQQSLIRMSKLLVDRYGTYSNRNNFENITGLEAYMTDRFKKESVEFISERQAQGVPEDYYSIITNALVAEIQSYSKQAATLDVSARRIETKTGSEQKVFTQHALVRFQAVSGNWKVDSIDWQ